MTKPDNPDRRAARSRRLRVRIAVVVGITVALGAWPAWAFWSAQQSVPAKQFDLGTMNLRVNGQDATAAVSGLTLANMMPGNSVAGIVTVGNAGSLPLSYWPTVIGSNADGKGMASSLAVTVRVGGTVSGTAPAQTCTGGTTPPGAATRVSTTSQVLAYGPAAAARQRIMPGASEVLCVQFTLDATAPGSLQGAATTLTITANGAQVGQP